MKYGVAIFPTDYAIRPDEVALAAEDRAASNPSSSQNIRIFLPPAALSFREAANCPVNYSHTIDSFVALTMAAAATFPTITSRT